MGNIDLNVSLNVCWSLQKVAYLVGIDVEHILDKRRLPDTTLELHMSGVSGCGDKDRKHFL